MHACTATGLIKFLIVCHKAYTGFLDSGGTTMLQTMEGEHVVCSADRFYRYDQSGICCGELVAQGPTVVRRPCARPYLYDCDVLYETGLERNGYAICVMCSSSTANALSVCVAMLSCPLAMSATGFVRAWATGLGVHCASGRLCLLIAGS